MLWARGPLLESCIIMPEKTEGKEGKEFRYLVRVVGTDIEGKMLVPYGLSRIPGFGIRTGYALCRLAGIDPRKRIGHLTEEESEKLDSIAEKFHEQQLPSWVLNRRGDLLSGMNMHMVGSDLVMSVREDINLMKKIKSYKGVRHILGLPVRGQRTRTSFRTGMTVGVSRKVKEEAAKAAAKEEREVKEGKKEKPAEAPKEAPKAATAPKEAPKAEKKQ